MLHNFKEVRPLHSCAQCVGWALKLLNSERDTFYNKTQHCLENSPLGIGVSANS